MHSFEYRNGQLHCEDVNLQDVAEEHGTPAYVYSAGTISHHYTHLSQALASLDHSIAYAVKANSNLSILKLLANLGSGFDIVSGGELSRVIAAGGDPKKCTFAGVGKTEEEITFALNEGIYCFNVESQEEAETINKIAGDLSMVAPVAFRVNPNVDAKTHKYISTGKSENKFGIEFEDIENVYADAAKLSNLKLKGLQMHIGSQLTSVTPFVEAVEKVAPLAARLKTQYGIEFLSIGGGIGIVYEDSLASGKSEWWSDGQKDEQPLTIEKYTQSVLPHLSCLDLKILVEPGRYIAGNAGVLLTKCLYQKDGRVKKFRIVDAGMNDLLRPALYEGYHEINPLKQPESDVTPVVDVVGPICETGDFFAANTATAEFESGDVIALMSAGAYGFAMASNYNTRGLPPEILVSGNESKVIRPRQSIDEIISPERDCL